jgi:hypothetical protein
MPPRVALPGANALVGLVNRTDRAPRGGHAVTCAPGRESSTDTAAGTYFPAVSSLEAFRAPASACSNSGHLPIRLVCVQLCSRSTTPARALPSGAATATGNRERRGAGADERNRRC